MSRDVAEYEIKQRILTVKAGDLAVDMACDGEGTPERVRFDPGSEATVYPVAGGAKIEMTAEAIERLAELVRQVRNAASDTGHEVQVCAAHGYWRRAWSRTGRPTAVTRCPKCYPEDAAKQAEDGTAAEART